MKLSSAVYPLTIVSISLHIAHSPMRRLKCVVDLYLCGQSKLADVPPWVPGTDN